MRHITFLLIFASCLCFSSCLNLIEEITLKKDGSGLYAITFDMSSMFSDPMMKTMIEEMIKQESGVGMGTFGEMDTSIYFSHAPGEVQRKMENPDFWKKVNMKINVSEADQKMVARINLEFDDVEDIDYFYKNLNQLEDSNNELGEIITGTGNLLTQGALFKMEKRNILTRLPLKQQTDQIKEDELQMAKMFFSNATYTTIYNLPSKIKKSSIPKGNVTENRIVAKYSFLDIIEGKAKMEGEIRFK